MKKTLPIAIIATSVLGLGCLTSCHDEDFDVSTAVLQERAFEQNFIKEFGKPSANQSWDFYAQKMESIRQKSGMTRATQAITVTVDTTISQPTQKWFTDLVDDWETALEEQHDNHTVGQNSYSLTSTGDFNIYAVRYAGAIETGGQYNLDFGLAYKDKDATGKEVEVMVPIFGRGYRNKAYRDACYANNDNGWGNPGKAAEVKIPEGQQFYFYLKYTYPFGGGYGTRTETFYSNQSPVFIRKDGSSTFTFPEFGGTSTLLYSTERIVPSEHVDEQVMIIGFEDAWGHDNGDDANERTQTGWFDRDFNDIVVIIIGKLPEPSSKRFFAEDLESFDYDYNDVVFDVSSNGIVLRAVGGSLPVFLRITNRLGNTHVTEELHELMKSLQKEPQTADQPDNRLKEVTYQRESDGKTFYKSIDVNGYKITGKPNQNVWLDPVQIVNWEYLGTEETRHTRLNEIEVEKFGEEVNDTYKGNVELIVLPEYKESYESYDLLNITSLTTLNEDDNKNGPKIIKMSPPGTIPSMWTGTVSTMWMNELTKITLGYPYFYGGTTVGEKYYYWFERDVVPGNLYDYKDDEP